ncbi:MAG: TRAP transporter permease [Candidatus Hodarchaeota archaeon]
MNIQHIKGLILAIVAIIMVLYHMLSSQYLVVSSMQHDNLHLAFSLVLVFLSLVGKSRWHSVFGIVAAVLSVLAGVYRHVFMAQIEMYSGLPVNNLEIVISIVLLILVFEAVRGTWGWILPTMVAIVVIYFFFYGGIPWDFTLGRLALAESGLYGIILRTSANFIFLFALFGILLNTCGATTFFIEASKVLQNRFTAGAAFAVVGSGALVGTASAAPPATGAMLSSFGLPLMKKAGYNKGQSAGILAVSATGGFIMPPVLGAVAFLMVSWIGVPYIRIMGAALFPALLYYLGLALYCHFQAKKMGVSIVPTTVDVKKILLRAPLFVVPLCILLVLLVKRYPLPYVIFWSIISLVLLSLLSKETRPNIGQWIDGVTKGAVLGAQIGVLCSLIGLIPLVVGSTGLAITLPQMVLSLGGGNRFLILIITAALSIILGCGVPVIAVYVMLATVASPPLVQMGFNELQAHFFIFYFAVLSFITPPVAPAVFVTAKMANSTIIRSGIEAVKAGAGGFFAPFFFVIFPAMLLLPDKLHITILGILLAVIFIYDIEAAQCNYMLTLLKPSERVVLFGSAGLIMVYLYNPSFYLLPIIGVTLFLLIFVLQVISSAARRKKTTKINIL